MSEFPFWPLVGLILSALLNGASAVVGVYCIAGSIKELKKVSNPNYVGKTDGFVWYIATLGVSAVMVTGITLMSNTIDPLFDYGMSVWQYIGGIMIFAALTIEGVRVFDYARRVWTVVAVLTGIVGLFGVIFL